MYLIFSLIKTNHPFLRVLCFLSMLMVCNTDSALLLLTIIIYAFTKLRNTISRTAGAGYKNTIPMHM